MEQTHKHETTTLQEVNEAFRQGKEAGKASRQGDWARVQETSRYFRRWINARADNDTERRNFSEAFRDGYKASSGIFV